MRIADARPLTIRPVAAPAGEPLRFQAERTGGFMLIPGDVEHLAEVAGRLNGNKPLSYAERKQLATIIEVVVRAGKKL